MSSHASQTVCITCFKMIVHVSLSFHSPGDKEEGQGRTLLIAAPEPVSSGIDSSRVESIRVESSRFESKNNSGTFRQDIVELTLSM